MEQRRRILTNNLPRPGQLDTFGTLRCFRREKARFEPFRVSTITQIIHRDGNVPSKIGFMTKTRVILVYFCSAEIFGHRIHDSPTSKQQFYWDVGQQKVSVTQISDIFRIDFLGAMRPYATYTTLIIPCVRTSWRPPNRDRHF